jgi:hypothetical protein
MCLCEKQKARLRRVMLGSSGLAGRSKEKTGEESSSRKSEQLKMARGRAIRNA